MFGNRQAVGVGVVGEDDGTVLVRRKGLNGVEGARFFGVGKGDGGKGRVGVLLGGEGVDGVEAKGLKGALEEGVADAVEGRVGNLDVCVVGRWWDDEARVSNGLKVGIQDLVRLLGTRHCRRLLGQFRRIVLPRLKIVENARRHAFIERTPNLTTILPVDLVTRISGRIV